MQLGRLLDDAFGVPTPKVGNYLGTLRAGHVPTGSRYLLIRVPQYVPLPLVAGVGACTGTSAAPAIDFLEMD
jgi:hypothetical protein